MMVDLGFKCNEDPMCNHCDKNLCRTRKFGIGGDAVFPTLSDLQKVELDEPYYWVNVDGERVKLDNIDYLMEQRLFRRTVAKQINKNHHGSRSKSLKNIQINYYKVWK